MSQDRNLKFLNNHRIVYRRDPITDKPDEVYDWGVVYHNGTHECYELFRTRAKITTYKSLKWHFLVLYYLNDSLSPSSITYIFRFIADKNNGFVTFFISNKALEDMIQDVLQTGGNPPKNKLRKVIFNDTCGLEVSEKLSIVGSIIGRSKAVAADDIYDAMLTLNEAKQIITAKKLAGYFDCSTRTIYRNMTQELKKEKELLNSQL